MILPEVQIQCPKCFESQWIEIDPGGGSPQELIQDCEVCCSPMELLLESDAEGEWRITTESA